MRSIALVLGPAVLALVACGSSNPQPKSATDLPADPHNAVGGGPADTMNTTETSQGNAPSQEQPNHQADETKKNDDANHPPNR